MTQPDLSSGRPVALIIGASSGIGESLCLSLATAGFSVALVARRQAPLEALAARLNQGHDKPIARWFLHDVKDTDAIPSLFRDISQEMQGLDVVVYNAGIMPTCGPDEFSFEKDQEVMAINLLGAMAWLNQAAIRFNHTQRGTIVGISSVAGERGRRGQPAYMASKAALTCFLESLRNRLAVRGVTVITIKPGPVKTPMTEGLKLPLMISAEDAAHQITATILRGRSTEVYVPKIWRPIMWVIRNVPSFLFRRTSI